MVASRGGQPRQSWYDDAGSLLAEAALVPENALGGVALWALGYDGEDPGIWEPLAAI